MGTIPTTMGGIQLLPNRRTEAAIDLQHGAAECRPANAAIKHVATEMVGVNLEPNRHERRRIAALNRRMKGR